VGFEEISYVDTGTYDAATNMAIEELFLERTCADGKGYLRVMGFEEPSFVLARRTSYEDIEEAVESGFDYTRCETAGSTIPCLDNGLAYSVTIPSDYMDKDQFFYDVVGPELEDLLVDMGLEEESIEIEKKYHGVRYGAKEVMNPTIIGSSLWRKKGAVLCHGVICLDPWDAEFLHDNMDLREDEEEFIRQLPSITGETGRENVREEVCDKLIDRFAGDEFEYVEPLKNSYESIDELLRSKYACDSWLRNPSRLMQKNKGHCFIEKEENDFY